MTCNDRVRSTHLGNAQVGGCGDRCLIGIEVAARQRIRCSTGDGCGVAQQGSVGYISAYLAAYQDSRCSGSCQGTICVRIYPWIPGEASVDAELGIIDSGWHRVGNYHVGGIARTGIGGHQGIGNHLSCRYRVRCSALADAQVGLVGNRSCICGGIVSGIRICSRTAYRGGVCQ